MAEFITPYVTLGTGFLVAFAMTALLVPLVRRWAIQQGWVDSPDSDRKLHQRPTPAIGGLAISGGFGAGLAYLVILSSTLPFAVTLPSMALAGGALLMVATGFYDDIQGMSFKAKFALQILVAYLLIHVGYRIDVSGLWFVGDDPYVHALYSIPLTMLWIVGVINAVNLLDGLDGLASGVVLIAFSFLALVFGVQGELGLVVVALAMVGALSGFLIYNFNPASIFMGDSGSLFLGCMLAAFSLEQAAHSNTLLALIIPIVVLGLPIGDTALAIGRRFASGRAICAPDDDHIHHRLTQQWSHKSSVLILYAVALWFGIAALLIALLSTPWAYVVLGLTAGAAVLGLYILGYLEPRGLIHSSERSDEAELDRPDTKSQKSAGPVFYKGDGGQHLSERSPELTPVDS